MILLNHLKVAASRLLSLAVSPVPYFAAANEIIAARGVSALYMGLAFKSFHLGGSGALLAFFIPFFKSWMSVAGDVM
jgi:hypothetical protein